MFYEQFEKLCKRSGERPYTLVRQLGVSSSSIVDQWKKGSVPRQAMLEKIADHFGVTIDYLLTGKETAPAREEPELSEDEVILLSAFRSLTEDQRRFVLRQLRAAAQEPGGQAGV